MEKELKLRIIEWLSLNENRWQRLNSCVKTFRMYIYDNKGEYIIGGDKVMEFIRKADNLLYS